MRNSHLLIFVSAMFVSALFIANYNKTGSGAYPPGAPAAGTSAAAASENAPGPAPAPRPSASPKLPPAREPAAGPQSAPPPAEPAGPEGMAVTVAGYAPEEPVAANQEIRGPVCVQVDNPGAREVITRRMTPSETESYRRHYDYAVLFLRNSCVRYILAKPPLFFILNNGNNIAPVAPYGFVLFDGVKGPRVVESINEIRQEYSAYFAPDPRHAGPAQ